MSGLECSEMLKSALERTARVDAEFYSKENLQIENTLKNWNVKPITDDFYVSDGNHMSVSDDFRDEGIPYYRGQDIYNIFIESACPICISEKYYNKTNMRRSWLKKNDILLSIVGAIIGNTSMVYTNNKATCSCKLAIIRPTETANPFLMNVFLKSRYGQNQIQKFRRGTAQTGFLLEDMEQLLVPEFGQQFGSLIQSVIEKVHELVIKSQEKYNEAEKILLSTLSLDTFTPSTQNTSFKSFSDAWANERLDAEYYQKKYDDLCEEIHQAEGNPNVAKVTTLSSVVSIKKSIEPGSEEYGKEGIPFLRVSDISKFELNPPDIFLDRQTFDMDGLKPKKGTILFSKDGSVGIAYKVNEDLDAITSSALLHLTVTDKTVNPDYLTLLLNSFLVGMQAERDVGGSILKHWRIDEIKNVKLPILQEKIQSKIAEKVRQSFAMREQSKALLKAATQTVEIAIEQDEAAGMEFLHKFSS